MDAQNTIDQAKVFHDFKGLKQLKTFAHSDNLAQKEEATRAVAEQFESFFMSMMMKSMRQASEALQDEHSPFSSEHGKFYQSMFDQQLSTDLSSHAANGRKGLGLADLMVQQMKLAQGIEGLENNKQHSD